MVLPLDKLAQFRYNITKLTGRFVHRRGIGVAPKLKAETLEERKAQILKAALTCFSRDGYHQTTMDDIVEEAGLSKGGVYWHFGSKKELFLSLFESVVGDTEDIMLASMATQTRATEKLAAMLDMFMAFATTAQFKRIMPLMIDVWAQNWQDPEVNEVATSVYKRYRGPMIQMIEDGIASGEFKPVDASALASILFALYDGLMVMWMIDASMVNWDAISETVSSTLFAGLLADEAA